MDFGVTFQTDPPAWRVVELTKRAEQLGFMHAWTFDSHILWQEPYVIYSQMLSATERIIYVHDAAIAAGRDPKSVKVCVAAPAYVGSDLAYQHDQCRWFGGMVGNHVADLVARYGEGGEIPVALTDYMKARQGYGYGLHGKADNLSTDFVPDDIVDRFCVLGTVEDHIAKLEVFKELGVDQFNIYLMHDAKEETLEAYGREIIPALKAQSAV